MRTHRWEDLKHKVPAERREEIRRQAIQELVEMDLREIRKAAGRTQANVAKAMETTQGEVSMMERREDFRLSSLKKFVEALGGKLEVIALVGGKRFKLKSVG